MRETHMSATPDFSCKRLAVFALGPAVRLYSPFSSYISFLSDRHRDDGAPGTIAKKIGTVIPNRVRPRAEEYGAQDRKNKLEVKE